MADTAGEARRDAAPIAITGASGFIGSHLLEQLNALERSSRVLVRSRPGRKMIVPDRTEIVSGSLSDVTALDQLLDGAKTCIHLAGATKSINASGFHIANVIGTYQLAARAGAAGVEHFIHVSSQAAREPHLSDYSSSKAASERALEPFQPKMKISVIRPPAVIGPGDPMLKPMFDLIRSGWLPGPSEPSKGARQFAVISVRDLVREIVDFIQTPPTGFELSEPSSVRSTTWDDVAKAAGACLEKRVRRVTVWPAILSLIGRGADGIAKLVRHPMPISHGKVSEMLFADWTYENAIQDAMSLEEIVGACLLDQ